jgi:hypothetical protein
VLSELGLRPQAPASRVLNLETSLGPARVQEVSLQTALWTESANLSPQRRGLRTVLDILRAGPEPGGEGSSLLPQTGEQMRELRGRDQTIRVGALP